MHLHVRNVSEALYVGLGLLQQDGEERSSRNGPMIEYPGPFITTYSHPEERVLFYPERDANPFFHLFESLWMLGGRNDVEFVARYVKRMQEYSTDGYTLRGAYGHRWRHWFGHDQIEHAIRRLQSFENDRRTVIAMWDGDVHRGDLQVTNHEKDVPCNTHLYLKVRDGFLNMTVCCRSNDAIWGAYGANAVHFSILHEYIARRVGVLVGSYTQLSDSFHAYTDVLKKLTGMQPQYDPYLTLGEGGLHYVPEPLFTPEEGYVEFDKDIQVFLGKPERHYADFSTKFFRDTVCMMAWAYEYFKRKEWDACLDHADSIEARDWRKACVEWLERRKK